MNRLIFGIILIIVSLFMLIGFFNANLKIGFFAAFLTFSIVVILPFFSGSSLIYYHYKDKTKLQRNKQGLAIKNLEAEVLKLAHNKGGSLTAVELMADLAIDRDTAKQVLESLAVQGLAEVEITESGVIVYSFYDVKHLHEKHKAKKVLDA